MKITILGCGASSGSPPIGGAVPANPKDFRTRASIYIEGESTKILVDTSPDLRAQALANNITRVDAIIYTHAHADHVHGIDDVKSLNYKQEKPIPAYGDKATLHELQERFAYCFRPPVPEYGWFRPCLAPNVIEPLVAFTAGGFEILPFRQAHTKTMDSLGLRIKHNGKVFVYSTDVKFFPPESESALRDIDLWIVDCLRIDPAPTHSDIKQTLGWVKKFSPRRTVLTHMGHQMRYDELVAQLPAGVEPGYDGLALEL